MRKLLSFSLNSLFIFISSFIFGCNAPSCDNNFKKKTYDDYYNSLENTTIEMELIVDNNRAMCLYSNDGETYVFTIKYQYSGEYGYIYNTKNNELFCIENQKVTQKKLNIDAENKISELYNTNNILFHLRFDTEKFEYIQTVTVCNKKCDKYRFVDKLYDTEATYNIYIDKETGFCLKAVCVVNGSTKIYFETKRFIKTPSIENYLFMIKEYNKNTR